MATKEQGSSKTYQDTVERIRQLNEQILESGKHWGSGFLDAYEQSLRAFADLQERSGERTEIEWLAKLAKAQADFTREVTKQTMAAAREFLK